MKNCNSLQQNSPSLWNFCPLFMTDLRSSRNFEKKLAIPKGILKRKWTNENATRDADNNATENIKLKQLNAEILKGKEQKTKNAPRRRCSMATMTNKWDRRQNQNDNKVICAASIDPPAAVAPVMRTKLKIILDSQPVGHLAIIAIYWEQCRKNAAAAGECKWQKDGCADIGNIK